MTTPLSTSLSDQGIATDATIHPNLTAEELTAAALENGGLDQLVAVSNDAGEHASLRRLVCDLIEEYGRHTGHADLLREAVDGRVGEDPPPDWRPRSRGARP